MLQSGSPVCGSESLESHFTLDGSVEEASLSTLISFAAAAAGSASLEGRRDMAKADERSKKESALRFNLGHGADR